MPAAKPPPHNRAKRRAVAIARTGNATSGGRGPMADAMIALARERGVPVRQDKDLAEVLSALNPTTAGSEAAMALTAVALDRLYRINEAAKPRPRETPKPSMDDLARVAAEEAGGTINDRTSRDA